MNKDVKWVQREHAPDCYAVQATELGTWDYPWAFLGEVVYRDVLGRKGHRTTRWARVICNCTKCRAEFLVRWSVVEDMLAALGKGTE